MLCFRPIFWRHGLKLKKTSTIWGFWEIYFFTWLHYHLLAQINVSHPWTGVLSSCFIFPKKISSVWGSLFAPISVRMRALETSDTTRRNGSFGKLSFTHIFQNSLLSRTAFTKTTWNPIRWHPPLSFETWSRTPLQNAPWPLLPVYSVPSKQWYMTPNSSCKLVKCKGWFWISSMIENVKTYRAHAVTDDYRDKSTRMSNAKRKARFMLLGFRDWSTCFFTAKPMLTATMGKLQIKDHGF